jgi:hypothetical protein
MYFNNNLIAITPNNAGSNTIMAIAKPSIKNSLIKLGSIIISTLSKPLSHLEPIPNPQQIPASNC